LPRLSAVLRRALPYIALLAILAYAAYSYYSYADAYTASEIRGGGKGYVSDEVWYVDAARNLLRKVFGAEPRQVGLPGATVVYSSNISLSELRRIARELGVRIVDDRYSELRNAVYVEAAKRSSIEAFARALNASDVVWGWRLGDASGINSYMNLEHPPLVKYLIALVMALAGDYPTYWRLPSVAAGLATVVLTYLFVAEVSGLRWLGVLAAGLLAVDPIMRAMSSVAMLDVYVAMFSVAAAYAAVKKGPLHGVLVAALGSTAKFSTLFVLPPLYLAYARRSAARSGSLKRFLDDTLFFISYTLLAFILPQVAVSIPLIASMGFGQWFEQCVIGAFQWHLTTKCVGESCPPASAPWCWFFNINPFPLYYFPTSAVVAQVNSLLWPIALAVAVVMAPGYAVDRGSRWSLGFLWGVFLSYVALWVLGNRSQYSFYAVQLAPFVYALLATAIPKLMIRRENALKVLGLWSVAIRGLWATLTKLLLPDYLVRSLEQPGGVGGAGYEGYREGSGAAAEGVEGSGGGDGGGDKASEKEPGERPDRRGGDDRGPQGGVPC